MIEPGQVEIVERDGQFYFRHPAYASLFGPWPSRAALLRDGTAPSSVIYIPPEERTAPAGATTRTP